MRHLICLFFAFMTTVLVHGETSKPAKGPKITTVTSATLPTLLYGQLQSEISDPKKHKPLLLALSSRQHKGTLEFNREFTKLADTVHRQYALALADCHFERDVCMIFNPTEFPALYLFKDNKVYLYNGSVEDLFKQEGFLHYLSSDNYLRMSKITHENSDELIKQVMGIGGSFSERFYSNYGKPVETKFTEWSKHLFKKMFLGHWP